MIQLGPNPDQNTVRLFERSDYWTAVGRDAEFIAAEYIKTDAVLKPLAGTESVCVALSRGMFVDSVRDMLMSRKLKLEVHKRVGGKWTQTDTASAGNLRCFEDLVLRGSVSGLETERASAMGTCTLAVKITSGSGPAQVLAGAAVDPVARELRVTQMPENDQYTNFEAMLVQLGATEVVLPASTPAPVIKRLSGIAQAAGVLVTTKPNSFFSASNVDQNVRRLIGADGETTLPDLEASETGSRCLAALLKYLELMDDPSTYGRYKMVPLNLAEYMRLDASAVSALHLFESGPSTGGSSLFSLLNKCRTPQGSRKLHQWIKQPLLDIVKISRRLDLVQLFMSANDIRSQLHSTSLRTVPDLFRISSKFLKGRASLEDMVRLYQVAARLPAMTHLLAGYSGPGAELLLSAFVTPLEEISADLGPFTQLVESTIDLALVDQHEYVILHTVDESLNELAQRRSALISQIRKIHKRVDADVALKAKAKTKAGKPFVKLEVNDAYGYYFRIPRNKESAIRKSNEYTTLETRKDGVKFASRDLSPLSNSFKSVVAEYNEKQAEMEAKVLEIGATYTAVFEDLNDVLASLDVLVALAETSLTAPIPYVRPNLVPSGGGGLDISGGRHPCLEALHDLQFIPNDVSLGVPGQKRLLLVTGPNMGGKSTYIRQIGVIVLMAQIGCFVPATSATIPVVDCILARVGAGDSQLRGVSTFMAEMLETSSILATATESSLIIVDELGRGTSTYDGYGLAYAIAEHIATKLQSLCVFATHFHELTQLEAHLPQSVANAHVTAHTADDALTLLYKVKAGPCDRSFGIHVARLAHFPPVVINMAKRKAQALEDFDDQLTTTSESSPSSKRLKNLDAQAIEAGESLIKDALGQARDVLTPLGSLDTWTEAHTSAVRPILSTLQSSSNPYVNMLLTKFGTAAPPSPVE